MKDQEPRDGGPRSDVSQAARSTAPPQTVPASPAATPPMMLACTPQAHAVASALTSRDIAAVNSLVQLLHDRPGWHGEDDALRTLIGKPYDYTEVEAADTVTRAHALGWIVFGPRDQTGAFRLRLSGAGRLMLETSDER